MRQIPRERVVEQLQAAAAVGRIDLEEFSERLGIAYDAKTYDELEQLVADVPPEPALNGALAELPMLLLTTAESNLL